MTVWSLVSLAIAFLVAGAFFSALESALAVVSRARTAEMAEEGRRGARRLLSIIQERPRYLSALVLLRIVCEIVGTVFVVDIFLKVFAGSGHSREFALVTAAVSMILILFVLLSVGPQTLGRQHAYSLATTNAWLLSVLGRLLGPISRLLVSVSNAITPGRGYRNGPFASDTELMEVVDMAEQRGVVEADEREMIRNVIDLGDTTAREVMVPRTEMVWVESDQKADHALELAVRSGHSRIPVIGENVDDIIGVFYLKDEVAIAFESRIDSSAIGVRDVMRKPAFIPDSKPLDDLLNEMQRLQFHVAILIDEYGGVAGLITIEDILEEIVGEITDEYDLNEIAPVEVIDEETWRVSARLSLEDFEELTKRVFAEDVHEEVDTVGGLMAFLMDRVPLPGDTVETQGLELCAGATRDHRGRLKLTTVLVNENGAVISAQERGREDQ